MLHARCKMQAQGCRTIMAYIFRLAMQFSVSGFQELQPLETAPT
jgi:hypothetical protein